MASRVVYYAQRHSTCQRLLVPCTFDTPHTDHLLPKHPCQRGVRGVADECRPQRHYSVCHVVIDVRCVRHDDSTGQRILYAGEERRLSLLPRHSISVATAADTYLRLDIGHWFRFRPVVSVSSSLASFLRDNLLID